MGAWDELNSPEYMARVVSHPARPVVEADLADLVRRVRAITTRDESRDVQEALIPRLLDAEGRQQDARRRYRRRETDRWDLEFWRRVCVQLRSIGDAVAWKFLEYKRQAILLMGQNQRPGLMTGKAGTAAEVGVFRSIWDSGRPALLTALTNQLTIADLLVDQGEGRIEILEVKAGRAKPPARQRLRMLNLQRQLTIAPRVDDASGPTYVVESSIPFRSLWSILDREGVPRAAERSYPSPP